MDFLSEYKKLLSTVLELDMESAKKLIKGFHESGEKPDSEALYLEAAYYYYSCQYGLALFYAEMAYIKDKTFMPVHQLIGYITDYDGDFDKYEPINKVDVSSYNKKLVILVFEGMLEIVDYTVEVCKQVLECLGHEVRKVHIGENIDKQQTFAELLECTKNKDVDFAFIFNNIGLSITLAGENYFDALKIPVFNYLFDHPMAFYDSLDNAPQKMILTCVDKKHVDYVKRFYRAVKDCFFFPLGSEESFESEAVPWKDRTIQALYVGSLKVADPSLSDEFSDYVYDYLIKNPSLTTEYAIEKCFKECDRELFEKIFGQDAYDCRLDIDNDTLKIIIQRYRLVDLNVNSYYRKMLVQILVENGIDVYVYGKGWNYPELINNEHFHYKGCVSQKECIKQMKNTRFVLNSMPWFKDGAHDRVYNAMLAGAVCVSDVSKYLTDEFKDGEDLVFYHLEEMEKLPELIKYYDSHQDEAEKIAMSGYSRVATKHTWQTRMIQLINRFFDGVEDFNFEEETICGHKVTKKIKKVWAKEIELLQLFDRVCKKHNLRYCVFYGTLLGAIRHKGFIPWDDDIDVVMPRPDYNKLLEIAEQEFQEPYFFQTAYNDQMIWAFSKIRDSRTTAIEFPDMDIEFNQGIFIDIFPLDAARDESKEMNNIFKVERDIWRCLFSGPEIVKYIDNEKILKEHFFLDKETLIDFLQMPYKEKLQQLELFANNHYNDSDLLCTFSSEMINEIAHFKKEWFKEIIYVPFCNIKVPVPKMYDEALTVFYGDYMTPVKGGSYHEGIIIDPDMPYKEWLKKYHEDRKFK